MGPNLAPYYMVEMAEYPDGEWTEVYEEVSALKGKGQSDFSAFQVRGISCDINGLTPLRDYR